MKLLIISIAFTLLGLGVGYIDAFKSITLWSNFYYLWDKTKDLLFALTLAEFVKITKIKQSLRLLASFFVIRIIWDLIAITTNYNTAASPIIMITMFTLWAIVVIILMVKGVQEEWQK